MVPDLMCIWRVHSGDEAKYINVFCDVLRVEKLRLKM